MSREEQAAADVLQTGRFNDYMIYYTLRPY
jgi:hypothetical protein